MKYLSLAVTLLALPALAAMGPSFEVPVMAPAIARAAGTQASPRVATDGRDFFAVWIDSRGGNASVYGTRILADGTVLDPTGILIAAPGGECNSPALAWDGSNYVVVWREEFSHPYSRRASFARVDRDGMVVGAPKTLLDGINGEPLIASNGRGSMVIFSISGPVLRIDQNGSVTSKPSVPTVGSVQIASNGDGYLVSWIGSWTYLLRLDDNGDAVAGSAQQLPGGFYTKLSAGIGGPYLLATLQWPADGSACARSIVGRFVTSKGLSDPFVLYDAGGSDIADFVVTPDRNGFQLVLMKRLGPNPCGPAIDGDPPSFHGLYPPFGLAQIHVSVDGSSGVLVSVAEENGTDVQGASVASTGNAEVIVWLDLGSHPNAMNAAIVHPGVPAAPIPIASSAAIEEYSCIAAAESIFMTAWVEGYPFDGGPTPVYARRFDTNGRALDAAPIKVSADNQTRNYAPVVLFDGAVWLFLWGGTPGGSARRMAADGSWIDAAPFRIGPTDRSTDFAAASNGNGFAVFTFAAGPELALTFIPRTGETRKVPISIFSGFTYPTPPSMAWDGSAYVVVWRDGYGDFIEGVRIDQNGQVVTPLFIVDKTTRFDDRPSVACREGSCAVAWQSNDSVAAASIIGGTVVPIKTMIDSVAPNTYAEAPRVLATRDGFQLFWSELGSATPLLFTAPITATGIGPRDLIGPSGAFGTIGAAMTTRGQLGLIVNRADNAPAVGGAMRAFLRVWLGERRRAVGR